MTVPPLTLDDVLVREPECIWTRSAGEVVVLQPMSGMITVLSEVAGEIWERIDGVAPIRDVAAGVAAGYDVDQHTALVDGLAFAAELLEGGLAHRAAPREDASR